MCQFMYLIGDLPKLLELSILPLQYNFCVLPGCLTVCRELSVGCLHFLLPCCIPGVCCAVCLGWCAALKSLSASCRSPQPSPNFGQNYCCNALQTSLVLTVSQCWRALIDPAVLRTKISCLRTRIAVTSFCCFYVLLLSALCYTSDFWFKQMSSFWNSQIFVFKFHGWHFSYMLS